MNESPKGLVVDFDDFTGDTINTDKYVATISAGGTFAITAQQVNGTVQGTTDGTDEDAGLLCTGLIYLPSNGMVRLETRVKFSVVSTLRAFVGFSDATTEADLLPMSISGTTWTTTASTACGLAYSSAATTPTWTAMSVDGDTDLSSPPLADRILTGCTPIADTYQTIIVELQDRGTGLSPICDVSVIDDKGRMFSKRFQTNLTRTTLLCGAVGFQNEGAVAHTMTIDYIEVKNSRA